MNSKSEDSSSLVQFELDTRPCQPYWFKLHRQSTIHRSIYGFTKLSSHKYYFYEDQFHFLFVHSQCANILHLFHWPETNVIRLLPAAFPFSFHGLCPLVAYYSPCVQWFLTHKYRSIEPELINSILKAHVHINVILLIQRKKWGFQIEANSHTDLIVDVHITYSMIYLCVKCEVCRLNSIFCIQ